MAISEKIRWKRLINEMRFYHNEIDLVGEVIASQGPEFYHHYVKYANSHGLSIDELNHQHSQRIQKLYNIDPVKITAPKISDLSGSLCGALVPIEALPEPPPEKIDEEVHASFHKLFKRLATKLHPDVGGPNLSVEEALENIQLFKKAKNALDSKKYFILLDIAERLGVTHSRNYKQQIKWMKKENVTLQSNLQQQKNTYNYYFSECETEEEKDALVRKFISHLFGILLP